MTVIAWDGKIIAADKQASRGGLLRRTTKILKFEIDGRAFIAGFSGTEQTGLIMADWYASGANPNTFPACQTDGSKESEYWSNLIIADGKKVIQYSLWPTSLLIEERFYAIGNGEDFAIGAMSAGADAIQAVEIACKHCENCGLGIDAYELETMRKIR